MTKINKQYTIGIRLENKSFESRVPLIPYDVRDLIQHEFKDKLKIVVQKSRTTKEKITKKGNVTTLLPRCFSDDEYQKLGVEIVENFNNCPVILGIKEIPITEFENDKTYVFFSHTYKGQAYNKEMFLTMIQKKCTLIDYELIVKNETEYKFNLQRISLKNQLAPASQFARTVFFGNHAGIVGAINTLWVLGLRLKQEGFDTPFLKLKQAKDYRNYSLSDENGANIDHETDIKDYEIAIKSLKEIADDIKKIGFPNNCPPIIIGVTGKSSKKPPVEGGMVLGHCAKGCKEVLDFLLPQIIEPTALTDENFIYSRNKVYVVFFDRTKTIDFKIYLPKLTVLLNNILWQKGENKLVTIDFLRKIYSKDYDNNRLRVIGDISCDPGGSVECCVDVSSEEPYYIYEVFKDKSEPKDWENDNLRDNAFKTSCNSNSVIGDGPIIMSVTNLPCEFPKEASRKFSRMLKEYIFDIARIDGTLENFEDLKVCRPIKRAIILFKGKITPDYDYLHQKYDIDEGK